MSRPKCQFCIRPASMSVVYYGDNGKVVTCVCEKCSSVIRWAWRTQESAPNAGLLQLETDDE